MSRCESRLYDAPLVGSTIEVPMNDQDKVLTVSEQRAAEVILTGTLTANRYVVVPQDTRQRRRIRNATRGGFVIGVTDRLPAIYGAIWLWPTWNADVRWQGDLGTPVAATWSRTLETIGPGVTTLEGVVVTSAAHGLEHLDDITVVVSSNTGQVPIGGYRINLIDANSFRIHTPTAAASSGTLSFAKKTHLSDGVGGQKIEVAP